MITKALNLILSEINQYIPPVGGSEQVILGNIAFNESPGQNQLQNQIVASLVNIEEESTMKNSAFYRKGVASVEYMNPSVNINLYVLFSCNYDNYSMSIDRLSDVIRFFQHRKALSLSTAGVIPPGFDLTDPEDSGLHLTPEFYTLTFEQINHLWGSLGGKQMPFVMYKIRLVTVTERAAIGEGPLIQEIQHASSSNVDDC